MGLSIKRTPTDRTIEFGGGETPIVHPEVCGGRDVNIDVRMCQNAEGQQMVDIACNLEEPLPLSSDEFDSGVSKFSLEHTSWRKIPDVLKEMWRVLKPGALMTFIVPNTLRQIQHLLETEDWDDASSLLFGGNDYPENTHRVFLSPQRMNKHLTEAGFQDITTMPFGEKQTDMVVQCTKPLLNPSSEVLPPNALVPVEVPAPLQTPITAPTQEVSKAPYLPEEMYTRAYYNGGNKFGGYRPFYNDSPRNVIITRNVLARKPESVLELGCGRGYVLKRLQDAGILANGMDIANHCYMTRVCEGIIGWDATKLHWPVSDTSVDLCFSFDFLDYIPEELLPSVFREMERTSKRGLHGVTFLGKDDGTQPAKVTVRSVDWWRQHLPKGHDVLSIQEMENGQFTEDILKGDGALKVNLGCCYTMSHYGWKNADILDVTQYAVNNGYHFDRYDARQGLPYGTGEVQCFSINHMLEHITYAEALSLLRECRRCIHKDGVMRILVPDAELLMELYAGNKLNSKEMLGLWQFDEINDGCAEAPTAVQKVYSILNENHQAVYDWVTMERALVETGWNAIRVAFRESKVGGRGLQIVKECLEMHPSLSLIVEATPKLA